jgi:hypothetical protein
MTNSKYAPERTLRLRTDEFRLQAQSQWMAFDFPFT